MKTHLPPCPSRLSVAVLLCLTALLSAAQPLWAQGQSQGRIAFDRWYVLYLGEDRCGYAHTVERHDPQRITTGTTMHLTVRRGAIALTVEQQTDFEETPDGKPIRATSQMKMGQMTVQRQVTFTDQGMRVLVSQGNQRQEQQLPPIEGDWLPPAAAQRHIQQQIDQGAQQIQVRTLDLTMGVTPVQMAMRVLGREDVEVLGKVVPAVVWEATVSSMPGLVSREYVDEAGRTLKTTVTVGPGFSFTMIEADKTLALSDLDPPEVLASLLVEPDRPIHQPRELRWAVYEVRLKEGATIDRLDLPRTGYQRVTWGDKRSARVMVNLDRPVSPGDDLPTADHLAASTMLNHQDPKIQALVREALGPDADELSDRDKALRLRQFVANYIQAKDLSVGMATASEVARTGQGDCSEHAVLLAAMLRAAGIPSRTACGLLYVDEFLGRRGVFGGHMWTQAWLPVNDAGGHAWVDLDATLDEAAFDAAHLTQATSALTDGEMVNDLAAMAPLLGALEIKVVDVSTAPARAPALAR